MESSDNLSYDDDWSSPLQDELFVPNDADPLWSFNANGDSDNFPLPYLGPPLPSINQSLQQTAIQTRCPNTRNMNDIVHDHRRNRNLAAPHRKTSHHLDLPNFPLATYPTGFPSNSSGRPPPGSISRRPEPGGPLAGAPARREPSTRSPTPHPAADSSSSTSLSRSDRPDTPWPDTDHDSDSDSDPSLESDSTSSSNSESDSGQANSNGYIDLTQDSPPTMPRARATLRPAPRRSPMQRTRHSTQDSSEPPSNPAKRRRMGTEISQSSQPPKKIEEVDLRGVDDDQTLTKVLEQQRMATVKAQQEQAGKSVKVSTLQCIICMDNMTDMTATHCGHIFCHHCLMEALIAGENQGSEPGRGVSKCPVCRKKVTRPTDRRDQHHVMPLSLKFATKSNTSKGKRRAVD